MARSLNKVQLIGNLTRDPELRYTPTGAAVCSFGLATNRNWTTDQGEKHDEAEFHNIVAWNKLAELCSQFLIKGRKVYLEGRLATRTWQAQDGTQKTRTEIVISDMILLDSKRPENESADQIPERAKLAEAAAKPVQAAAKVTKKEAAKEEKEEESVAHNEDNVAPEDIPF